MSTIIIDDKHIVIEGKFLTIMTDNFRVLKDLSDHQDHLEKLEKV